MRCNKQKILQQIHLNNIDWLKVISPHCEWFSNTFSSHLSQKSSAGHAAWVMWLVSKSLIKERKEKFCLRRRDVKTRLISEQIR